MYMHKNEEQARHDRKQEIEGSIEGIYARNNGLKNIPIDKKSMTEIVDHLAPFYITMSQYDFDVLKGAIKIAVKNPALTAEQKKTIKQLFDKIALFC